MLMLVLAQFSAAQQAQPGTRPSVGTVTAISGSTITMQTDTGATLTIHLQEGARVLKMAPGQTSLKDATPIQLQDLQVGDRMMARGAAGDNGSLNANMIVVMTKGDVAKHQQQDLQDWQRRGTGGIVSGVDPASGAITVKTTPKDAVVIHTSANTHFLRYAPNSVKFDDAVKSSLSEIHPGDQLRAKGAKSADGKELSADDVIAGAFRNIAGTLTAIDAAGNTITVQDLLSKKSVTVKLTPESNVRKLPPQIAQRVAMMVKVASGEIQAPAGAGEGAQRPAGPGGAAGPGAGTRPPGGAPDFQQMLSRIPAATLADMQKGDAVMIVATPGSGGSGINAITLLAGVEPILTASPSGTGAASLLSNWSISAGGEGGGEGAGPQ